MRQNHIIQPGHQLRICFPKSCLDRADRAPAEILCQNEIPGAVGIFGIGRCSIEQLTELLGAAQVIIEIAQINFVVEPFKVAELITRQLPLLLCQQRFDQVFQSGTLLRCSEPIIHFGDLNGF